MSLSLLGVALLKPVVGKIRWVRLDSRAHLQLAQRTLQTEGPQVQHPDD